MKFVFSIFISLFLFGCWSNDKEIIQNISSKYSTNDLNSFYERNFYSENDGNWMLQKWANDIHYYIKGDSLFGDRKLIHDIVNEINSLNISIRISEANNESEANLIFTFYNSRELDTSLRLRKGNASLTITQGQITSAMIKIPSKSYLKSEDRKAVLFHELLHALGFSGHVSTTTKSVACPSSNMTTLSKDDRIVLKMLYEPIWPKIYTIKNFELDFSDLLYHVRTKEKLRKLIRTNKVSIKTLESLLNHSLTNDSIIKYASPITITTKNASILQRSIIKKTICELNSVTDNLLIEYNEKDSLATTYGIQITFINDLSIQDDTIRVTITPSRVVKNCHFKTRIFDKLSFTQNEKLTDYKIRKIISDLLFYTVCPCSDQRDFFSIGKDNYILKPEFKEVLRVYYSSEIRYNYTKSDLEEVIQAMK